MYATSLAAPMSSAFLLHLHFHLPHRRTFFSPTPWPAVTRTSAVKRRRLAAVIGCLYVYGLPLRLPFISIINVIIVIVIVHPLFKWNFYLSLYVILYVFLLS